MSNLACLNAIPLQFFGVVEEFEASGGGPNSALFSFYLNNASFQIRDDVPDKMFSTMSSIVADSYFSGKPIAITTYEQLPSGIYLVNIIRHKLI